MAERIQVNVRNVDGTLWRRLMAEAALRKIGAGELLNDILAPALANLEAARAGQRTGQEMAYEAGYRAGQGRT